MISTNVRRCVLLLLCTAELICFGADQLLRASPQSSGQNPSFIVRGTLVDNDGNPVVGVRIWVHKGDKDGLSIETGPDGRGANPNVATTAGGKFSVEVKRGFLPANRKITLSCYRGGGVNAVNVQLYDMKNKAPLYFEIAPDIKELDLDKLVGKVIVR